MALRPYSWGPVLRRLIVLVKDHGKHSKRCLVRSASRVGARISFQRRTEKACEEAAVMFALPSDEQKARIALDARTLSNVAVQPSKAFSCVWQGWGIQANTQKINLE